MIFDLSNFWIFVLIVASLYLLILNFVQDRLGWKSRLQSLQKEMAENQKKMIEAAKARRDEEYQQCTEKYNKQTIELMKLQLKLTALFLALYYPITAIIFPAFEPGFGDDVHLRLYDDGLGAHCDLAAGDGIFSVCYSLPQQATKGAWVIDGYLNSSSDFLAREGTAIYVEEGKKEDVWLQSLSAKGPLDFAFGKEAYSLYISTDKEKYAAGEQVQIVAIPQKQVASCGKTLSEIVRAFRQKGAELSEKEIGEVANFTLSSSDWKPLSIGNKSYFLKRHPTLFGEEALIFEPALPSNPAVEAVLNSGTFFHIDLPFALPLLNIRRIIGSTGVFIFFVFVIGLGYSIASSAYKKFMKSRGA
ncbi:MAG: hypothetical protein N3G22_00815 [Candidatus Micrarchaeota archaeon]|nr:hypothetical protein [Candidatus Micrarchaeota archaeon]